MAHQSLVKGNPFLPGKKKSVKQGKKKKGKGEVLKRKYPIRLTL